MTTIKAYLSLSSQFSPNRKLITEEIVKLLYHANKKIKVDIHSFSGGHYTSPKNEIGINTDIVFTYVPHSGRKVGKGTASEIKWALKNNKPVICIHEGGNLATLVAGVHNEDPSDWRNHAYLDIRKELVSDACSREQLGGTKMYLTELLSNFGLLPVDKFKTTSREQRLLLA